MGVPGYLYPGISHYDLTLGAQRGLTAGIMKPTSNTIMNVTKEYLNQKLHRQNESIAQ